MVCRATLSAVTARVSSLKLTLNASASGAERKLMTRSEIADERISVINFGKCTCKLPNSKL
jgi:hypothetical protein